MAYSDLSYSKIGWKNRSEALTTPLGKTNLNKMDEMIYNLVIQLREAYNELNTGKLPKTDANGMVSGVDYNSTTGIFTFHFYGTSSTKTVDLNIEKIPVSFSMDANGIITMTTADGTKFTADVRSLIPIFNFSDGDIIDFTVSRSGQTYAVSANIKEGSIEEKYLEPNFLANCTMQAGIATSKASEASGYASDAAYDAKLSQSYAVGGSGIRDGENTDNALYYKNQTAGLKNDVAQLKSDAESFKNAAHTSASNAYASEANAKESEQNATSSALDSASFAQESARQALLSKSYAVGDESARRGSSTDNALAYKNLAQSYKEIANQYKDSAKTSADNAKASEDSAKDSEDNAKISEETALSYLEQVEEIVDNEKDVLHEINKKLSIATFSLDDDGNLVYTEDIAYEFSVDDNGDLNYSAVI